MDAQDLHPGFARAVDYFGSQAEMARRAGVSPQYVSECKRVGFSAETALALERVSNGALRALDLVREGVATGAPAAH